MFTIYKITNIKNNKVYIGQTTRSIEDRMKRHIGCSYGSCPKKLYLQRAIRKYGPSSFTIEAIDYATTRKEADNKEIYWISKYDSLKSKNGYNMAHGGHGGNTYVLKTENEMLEIKLKIGKANSGGNNGNATKIKSFDLVNHKTNHFGSFSEAIKFFELPSTSRLLHKLCSKNKKYGIEILFKDRFIFAYESDLFNLDFILKPLNDKTVFNKGTKPFGVFDMIEGRYVLKALTKKEIIKNFSLLFNKPIKVNMKKPLSNQLFENRYKIQAL